jgi:hypothetical protein
MVVDDGKEWALRVVDDASPPDATRVVDRIAVCRYDDRKPSQSVNIWNKTKRV